MQRWHTLAAHYNHKCGCRVQKIPLDAGASCPNRDGTLSRSGCTFCNANGSGSGRAKQGDSLLQQWNAQRAAYLRDDPNTRFIAYLQSFSNTYGPQIRLQQLLQTVCGLPECFGVAVGTRPDCLDGHKLDTLAALNCDLWLELGLQTAHNATLNRINRGHTAADSEKAVRLAAERGIAVCAHLMAGLPGEDERHFLQSLDWALSLPIKGLKLHNLYVPKGTALATHYAAGLYHPLWRDEYVDTLCAALPRIPSSIVIHRLQSDPAPRELLAPTWASDKRGLLGDLRKALGARELWQGKHADSPLGCPAVFLGAGGVRDDL
ncbi:TIGR01212 family radical SAM protein [Desulfovibrio sp.]|uniref:TIGR01212 family radical SAM protein n=1 Tax=Desulfovibrio sp. TaxID=885 RepID=UPI0035AE214F